MQDQHEGSTPTAPNRLDALLNQAHGGCIQAAQELVNGYAPILFKYVRKKLNQTPRLRSIFDSKDFIQQAYVSLFEVMSEGGAFHSEGQLLAFLIKVVVNKVREAQRHFLGTQKADLNKEVQMSRSDISEQVDLLATAYPVDTAMIEQDDFDRLTKNMMNIEKLIIRRSLDGRTYAEIAQETELSERTIASFVKRIRKTCIREAYETQNGAE